MDRTELEENRPSKVNRIVLFDERFRELTIILSSYLQTPIRPEGNHKD
jgi:hypothetical protein